MGCKLILVGGTGQRFGLTLGYLHLLGIAGLPTKVVILDAEGSRTGDDKGNAVTKAVDRLLTWGHPDRAVERLQPYLAAGGGGTQLRDALAPGRSRLFPLCFTAEESHLAIERGFFGNPKAASVVFRALLEGDQRGDALKRALEPGGDGNDDVVAIVGSLSGGTGAGIFLEVARKVRALGAQKVLGIAFSHYFSLDHGEEVKTQTLEQNARLGFRYLLDKKNTKEFGALALIGPPPGGDLPKPLEDGEPVPHSFPGFLAAASLLSDGGQRLWAAVEDFRRARARQNPPPTYTILVGGRTDGPCLNDGDIEFPVPQERTGHPESVPGDVLAQTAAHAIKELENLENFSLTRACGKASLFVERKLGKGLAESLRSLGRTPLHGRNIGGAGRIDPRDVAGTERALRVATNDARSALESFKRWLERMGDEQRLGLKGASSRVGRKAWRDALKARSPNLAGNPQERLVRLWCRDVAEAQWEPRPSPTPGTAAVALFPYLSSAHAGLKSGRPGYADLGDASIQVDGTVTDRSFPTPWAAAEAFALRLVAGDSDALRVAEELWLCVTLGWLRLERFDLKRSPEQFDRLVEGFGEQQSPVYLLVESAHGGAAIGASDSKAGLWLGARPEHRDALHRLAGRIRDEDRAEARMILATWRASWSDYPNQPVSQLQPWAQIVHHIVGDLAAPRDLDNVRSIGPLLLEGAGPEPIYLFAKEGHRAGKVRRFLKDLTADDRFVQEAQELERKAPAGDERLSWLLRAGYLDWASSGAPGEATEVEIRSGIATLDIDAVVKARLGAGGGPAAPSVRIPDLLWKRDPRQTLKLLPEEPPVGSHFPWEMPGLQHLPHIEGVYFHRARKKWIVWLKDEIFWKESQIERDPENELVIRFGKDATLVCPSNTEMLKPGDILAHHAIFLVDQDGREILPKLPVKRDCLDLVLQVDQPASATRTQGGGVNFKIPLVGGAYAQGALPAGQLVREDRLHMEIWPNVSGPHWKMFWCGVETDTPEELGALRTVIFARSADGHYEAAGEHRGPGYWEVRKRPCLVWVGDERGGAAFQGLEDPVPELAAGIRPEAPHATLAIDFGTFRTTLAVQVGSAETALRGGIDSFRVQSRKLVAQENGKAATWAKNQRLLPRIVELKDADSTAPVSALVLPTLVARPEHGPELPNDAIPFRDFTIPIWETERLTGIEGFKWIDRQAKANARGAYLRAILTLAAAEAFSRGARKMSARYAFPLSMPEVDLDQIKEDFTGAAAWVGANVLDLSGGLPCTAEASESAAGVRFAEGAGHWILTLDLGGETLDLGLFESQGRMRKPLAWDSVRLGGNLVADALQQRAHPEGVRWHLERDTYRRCEFLKADVERLLYLALEYAGRFVAGMVKPGSEPREIHVVLLGGGWRWYRDLSEGPRSEFDEESFQRRFVEFLRQRVGELAGTQLEIGLGAGVLGLQREKLAVAVGLLRSSNEVRGRQQHVRAPNGLDEVDPLDWRSLAAEGENHGLPKRIHPSPGLPLEIGNLVRGATLEEKLPPNIPRSIQSEVKSRLEGATATEGWRKRTALGMVYEAMKDDWFRLSR